MEIAQIIDDALDEYYSELGLPVPNWKRQKDPQWWTDYLKSLGRDPRNPQCTKKNTLIKKVKSVQTYGMNGIGYS